MFDTLATVAVTVLVVYVWMIKPMRYFLRRGRGTRLPDPWVT